MREAGPVRLGGIVWICAVQFFVMQAVVELGWTTPYSLLQNYISDLGNTACGPYPKSSGRWVCSPWHAGMNASFALQGLIIAAGSLLVRRAIPRGAARSAGVALLVAGGLGNIAVGLYPENVNILAHSLGALGILLLGNLGLLPLGAALSRDGGRRGLGLAAIASGAVGVVATVLFVTGHFGGIGVGGMERVAAYTLPLWLIAAGISFAKREAR